MLLAFGKCTKINILPVCRFFGPQLEIDNWQLPSILPINEQGRAEKL
jgi:hypothetical protein